MGKIAVILKKTESPPIGQMYCGTKLKNGLTPILLRAERQRKKDIVTHDVIVAYQQMITQGDGLVVPFMGYTMTPVATKDIDPHALYPVAIFNITTGRLRDIMCTSRWKKFPLIDDSGAQYLSLNNDPISVFYWVINNTRYVPRELPQGGNDDGNWEFGKPIAGEAIIRKFDELMLQGRRPLEYATEVTKLSAEVAKPAIEE